jgi:isochorismate pyruvate lyase
MAPIGAGGIAPLLDKIGPKWPEKTERIMSLSAYLLRLAPLAVMTASMAASAAQEVSTTHPAYRGVPSAAGGTCCETLAEVRSNIDRIDHVIVRLLADRQSFVHEAGRFKANPDAVDDPVRVAQIIDKLRRVAEQDHVSPDVVEATYRAMIAAFTVEERRGVAASAPVTK